MARVIINRAVLSVMAKEISKETGYSDQAIKDIVIAYCEKIKQKLSDNQRVILPRLGYFQPIMYRARNRYSINDGKSVRIPRHRRIKFKESPDANGL